MTKFTITVEVTLAKRLNEDEADELGMELADALGDRVRDELDSYTKLDYEYDYEDVEEDVETKEARFARLRAKYDAMLAELKDGGVEEFIKKSITKGRND